MSNFVLVKIRLAELADFKFVTTTMSRYFQSDIDWNELVVKTDYFQHGAIDSPILHQ